MRASAALALAAVLGGCRFVPETGTLKIGATQAIIRQEDGQSAPAVVVTVPVLAVPSAGTTYQLARDGHLVSAISSPSATLAGGTDLIDDTAPFKTRLSYEVVATFEAGNTAKGSVGIGLTRTLQSFPRIAEPAQGSNLQGVRPKFRWELVGLETALLKLDVTPTSGTPQSWYVGRGKAEFDWGTPATDSATGFPGFPRTLTRGVEVTAQVTAIAGPTDRTDSSGSRTQVVEQVRSRAISFTP